MWLLFTVGLSTILVYNAIERNDIAYQSHPAAALLGSILSPTLAGFALY